MVVVPTDAPAAPVTGATGLGARTPPTCKRTVDPARELRERAAESLSLRVELTRQRLDVLAQSLLEAVQTIDLILRATARFGDDLAGALLRARGHLAGLGLGFGLRLFDELLGHDDHRGDLFGAAHADVAHGAGAGAGATGAGDRGAGAGAGALAGRASS